MIAPVPAPNSKTLIVFLKSISLVTFFARKLLLANMLPTCYIIAKLPSNNNKEYRTYIQKFYSTTADYLKRIDRTLGPGEVLSTVRAGSHLDNTYAEVGTQSVMNNSLNILTSFKALYALPDLSRMHEVSRNF